jgi:putative aldouronate transport system permease protein
MRRRTGLYDIIVVVILAIVAFICLAPLVNSLAISLSDRTSAAIGKVSFWPVNFTIASYENIIKEGSFFTAFWISIKRVLLGTSINVALIVVTAFPLARDRRVFRMRNVYMWTIVFTMLFSGGLIPLFILVKNLNLMDTLWALVLPGAVPVFSVILLMNFFKGLPRALEEAAIVDGANPLVVLGRIYIPLSLPAIATVTLFAVVGHWNAYFDGKIFINTLVKVPLATYIQSLTASLTAEQLATLTPQELVRRLQVSDLTFNAAKAIVAMVPLLLLYPFLQRYFVTGIVMGAVKG